MVTRREFLSKLSAVIAGGCVVSKVASASTETAKEKTYTEVWSPTTTTVANPQTYWTRVDMEKAAEQTAKRIVDLPANHPRFSAYQDFGEDNEEFAALVRYKVKVLQSAARLA